MAWTRDQMAERAAKEQRLRAMAAAVALYEAEFGAISNAELGELCDIVEASLRAVLRV